MGKKHSSGALISGCILAGALIGGIGGAYAASSKRGRAADKELKHFGKKTCKRIKEYSEANRRHW